jgi:UrcA family protein
MRFADQDRHVNGGNPMITHLKAVYGAALAAMISSAAAGQPLDPGDGALKMSVSVSDLRLDTEAGQRVAHARLARAAELVCGSAPSTIADLVRQAKFDACKRQALQDAERRLAEMVTGQRLASR